MTREELLSMDGLAQLQAIGEGRLPRPPVAETLDFTIVELERGRIVIETVPPRSLYNPFGTVTGGYAATMLDCACGLALQAGLPAGVGYTTLEIKVAYHRALTERSGPVRTSGRVVTPGRRVGFTEAELFDREGRLCGSATSTLLIFDARPATSSSTQEGKTP